MSFRRLEVHRRRNNTPWLKTFQSAASAKTGDAELYTYGDLGTTTTHLPYEGETRSNAVKPLSVPTVALDDLVAKGELRRPRFIKLDVEGHGHQALSGMRRTLAEARPLIFMGFHSPQEREGAISILGPLEYVLEPMDEGNATQVNELFGDFVFRPEEISPKSADQIGAKRA
jgi:FkbM family methyltransferase